MPPSTVIWPDQCKGPGQCALARQCLFHGCLHYPVRGGRQGAVMPWLNVGPVRRGPSDAEIAAVAELLAPLHQAAEAMRSQAGRAPIRAAYLATEDLRLAYRQAGIRHPLVDSPDER